MSQYTVHDSIIDQFCADISDIRIYSDHCIIRLKNSNEEIWFEPLTDSLEMREIVWELYTSAEYGYLFNSYIEKERELQLKGLWTTS